MDGDGSARLAWRVAAVAMLMVGPAQAATLTVTVSPVRNDQGLVQLCLFTGPRGFPECAGDPSVQRRRLPAQPGVMTTTFDVPPGVYAVTVFHDEKRLGRVETNFIGIPRSGVGASNNPTARFGPPGFDAAAFTMPDRPASIAITLRYP